MGPTGLEWTELVRIEEKIMVIINGRLQWTSIVISALSPGKLQITCSILFEPAEMWFTSCSECH